MNKLEILSRRGNISISAIETKFNNGIFKTTFQLANKTDQASNMIEAVSHSITIAYTDKRPAGYSVEVNDSQDQEKCFALEINILIPSKTGIEATSMTPPLINDTISRFLLSTTIINNNDKLQPFIALIDIRDDSGATVFLAFSRGTLKPLMSSSVGVAWQPEHEGKFEVRTFTVTILGADMEILSPLAASNVTIHSK